MVKKHLMMLVALMFIFSTTGLYSISAAENLSPMETVDWEEKEKPSQTEDLSEKGSEEATTEASNSKKDAEEASETSIESNQESTKQESNQSQSGKTPQDLKNILEIIKNDRMQMASDYYLLDIKGEEDVNVILRGYVSKEDVGYFTIQEPPFLPQTYLLETEGEKINALYLPMEYLATYAADAINMYPHVYSSSPIEDFYVFVQKNHDQIKDKFVRYDSDHETVTQAYQEYLKVNQLLKETTIEFLENYGSEISMETDDTLLTLILQEDIAKKYSETLSNNITDDEVLSQFKTWVDQGIEGTITIDQETFEIGVGLLSDQGDGTTKGIEYYIQPVEQDIQLPNDDQIMDNQALIELTGSNIIEDIDAYNREINIEAFSEEVAD